MGFLTMKLANNNLEQQPNIYTYLSTQMDHGNSYIVIRWNFELSQGKALNAVASRNVKVIVVGNPCNTKYGQVLWLLSVFLIYAIIISNLQYMLHVVLWFAWKMLPTYQQRTFMHWQGWMKTEPSVRYLTLSLNYSDVFMLFHFPQMTMLIFHSQSFSS
jgi:hypothetical protein